MNLLASENGLRITLRKILAPALNVIACIIIVEALLVALLCMLVNALDGF